MMLAESASASSCGSWCASAPCYGRSEDVTVVPVVVAELELRDVKWQLLLANFMEAAHYAAFNQRPEALNRVRVDRADNAVIDDVLAGTVVDNTVEIFATKAAIAREVVGTDQADAIGDGF